MASTLKQVFRTLLVRLGLLTFGLLVALILLEAVLQAAALYTRATGGRAPEAWTTTHRRVVAIGDSNTYGFYVGQAKAYPQRLQEQWNAADPADPIEVVNLGIPGMNSSILRARLPQVLDTFLPDQLLVMIGANDYWTKPVPTGTESEGNAVSRTLSALPRRSRVFRFFYMLRRAIEKHEVEYDLTRIGANNLQQAIVRYGDRELDLSWSGFGGRGKSGTNWTAQLRSNLAAVAATAAQSGVVLTLVTYPAETVLYDDANRIMRQVGAETGARVVDLGKAFQEICSDETCTTQLFYFDMHPTAEGHELAARLLREQLAGRHGSVTQPAP